MVLKINHMFIFNPYKPKSHEITNFINNYKNNAKLISFNQSNLYGALVNSYQEPSWNDNIFLFFHGNGGWIGSWMDSNVIKFLSKFGSIFIIDYSGYGLSLSSPTEEKVYDDAKNAWDYLINIKKINPQKIIIYGHSLGTSIGSKLVSNLVLNKENSELPKAIFLEAPFYDIVNVAKDMYSQFLSKLVLVNFNNHENLKNIDGKIPIYILHSQNDEIIPYNHSMQIKNAVGKCNFIEIHGGHNEPIYNEKISELLKKICK